MIPPTTVLGIDGGLAHLGWCVALVYADGKRPFITGGGVIETVKNPIGTAAADNVRRSMELASALERVVRDHCPRRIVGEAMSFPRNASAAAMLSQSWGVVAAIAERFNLAVDVKSPMALKGSLGGSRTASKTEVIAAIRELYPELVGLFPPRRDLHEPLADAALAMHAFFGARQ